MEKSIKQLRQLFGTAPVMKEPALGWKRRKGEEKGEKRGKGDRQEDPEIGRPPNTWRQPGARVGRRPGRTGDRARGMLASDGAASRCTGTHACAHPGGAPAFCAGRWPSVNSVASLRAPATPSECTNSPVSSVLHTEGLTFPSGTVCILMLLCSSPMQAAASYFESSERFRS